MMAARTLVALSFGWAAFLVPGTAVAQQQVPLIVHWDNAQPARIILQDGADTSALPRSDSTKTFTGTMVRPPAQQMYRPIKLIVSYGDVEIPIIVNVRTGSAKIEIWLPFDPPKSCFDRYLVPAENRTDNTISAMRSMLTVAYAMRINAPNDCKSIGYEARATRARLARNQNLAVYSGGLFGLNEDWRRDAASMAPDSSRVPSAALADSASAQATAALVASLYRVDMAQAASSADSLAIASGLKELADRDPDAKAILKTVPLDRAISDYRERVANEK